jgi:pantoate--beta-alanine ligase
MIVAHEVADVRKAVREARRSNLSVGCVPTMGALHAGHMSLIEAARRDCRLVAVTIFVNPTQFGPNEDFSKYPRPLDHDLRQCEAAGVDLVFAPAAEAMYPPAFGTFVEVEALERILEGAFRPGHFRGVATIVLKLLNLVQPDAAYFGRKDFQQQLLVRKMCRELDLPVEIRTCPTVREPDGLALSSRNRYLDLAERQKALALSQALRLAEHRLRQGESDLSALRLSMRRQMESAGLTVDYATIADPENLEELSAPRAEMVALVAARVGRTRLIDNFSIVLQGAPGLRSSE